MAEAAGQRLCWIRLGVVAWLLILAGISWALLLPSPARHASGRIVPGMMEANVVSMLGAPLEGEIHARKRYLFDYWPDILSGWGHKESVERWKGWSYGDGVVLVGFDNAGTVVAARVYEPETENYDWLARLRDWLRF